MEVNKRKLLGTPVQGWQELLEKLAVGAVVQDHESFEDEMEWLVKKYVFEGGRFDFLKNDKRESDVLCRAFFKEFPSGPNNK